MMNIKRSWFSLSLILLTTAGSCQEKTSGRVFEEIALVNKIDFVDPKFDQPKFSCGFLLKYNNDTFAVTAKHIVKLIKPSGMTTLSFGNTLKSWSLFPLNNKAALVTCDRLLNENSSELLKDKSTYENDWLVFSIKQNLSNARPLQMRTTPLNQHEKLYVVGWTRTMESGAQRVYEFEYYKTIGNRILLKDILVPDKFGGLSGAPVLDEQGLLVGIVSNATEDPDSEEKYFSPCTVAGVSLFLGSLAPYK